MLFNFENRSTARESRGTCNFNKQQTLVGFPTNRDESSNGKGSWSSDDTVNALHGRAKLLYSSNGHIPRVRKNTSAHFANAKIPNSTEELTDIIATSHGTTFSIHIP